jgi:hypothetical protein
MMPGACEGLSGRRDQIAHPPLPAVLVRGDAGGVDRMVSAALGDDAEDDAEMVPICP